MTVFADTFAFIAWLSPRDSDHVQVSNFLANHQGQFITTEWVLVELADALCAPASRGIAAEFLQAVRVNISF